MEIMEIVENFSVSLGKDVKGAMKAFNTMER